MKKDTSGFFLLQLLIDAVLIPLGIILAFQLRYETIDTLNWEPFVEIWWVLLGAGVLLFYFFESYKCGEKPLADSIYESVLAILLLSLFTMALTYFTRGFAYPRSIVLISFFVQGALLAGWKVIVYFLYHKIYPGKSLLVFGTKEENERTFYKLLMDGRGYGDKTFADTLTDEVRNILHGVDEVIIPMSFSDKDEVIRICFDHDIHLSIIPTLFEVNLFSTELKQIDDIPILSTKPFGLNQVQLLLKRIFDILSSGIALILLSPVFLIVMMAIAIESGFPVIYKQERLTRGDKRFFVRKFRTMVKDAESKSGPVLAAGADNRITKVGRFLRSTRLDEIPQFLNVFLGEMSLVGPRPERSFFVEEFSKELPEFRYRTRVKAGITGLGQVLGKYTTTPKDKLNFDMIYIRNYSFLLDLKLCFQTLKIFFVKSAAEGFREEYSFEAIKNNKELTIFEGDGYFTIKDEK